MYKNLSLCQVYFYWAMTIGVTIISGLELLLVASYGTSINNVFQNKTQNSFWSRIQSTEICGLEHRPCWEKENVMQVLCK